MWPKLLMVNHLQTDRILIFTFDFDLVGLCHDE